MLQIYVFKILKQSQNTPAFPDYDLAIKAQFVQNWGV